jgi:hypothetical protein
LRWSSPWRRCSGWPLGVVYFAIAVIIAVVVLYLVNMAVDYIAAQMSSPPGQQPPGWATPVKYVLGAVVLIGLLIAAADLLFGYRIVHLSSFNGAARSAVGSDSLPVGL